MTQHHSTPRPPERYVPPTGWPSLTSLVVAPLVLFALLWAMTAPVAAVGVAAPVVAVVVLLRRGGPRLLRRLYDRTRKLTIPGIGTVEYRITAR
ncbi:MAG: hypothetical protein V5A46_05780 [Haloferacaceae archaeon]